MDYQDSSFVIIQIDGMDGANVLRLRIRIDMMKQRKEQRRKGLCYAV
jgi:hypothetical protein